ncbi:peptide ABC transporter substrate-binding protein [Thermoanaerobacterium thermosaccharolyticum]|uniref:peptide ABC transporter substrate-binding protein n=1 Tax=Thermoanaerobacterium thermosaccharolyticum TaxID=1517 RepID=UPI0020A5C794|nr:peptide ABC transporter substrate-binding protein [Thermoanaerobacterium thermosaccharolyticum]MCP2239100.1 oligopeptide transport system substrate-binding protein [Thermoanaerobacterium thermosaccharolyticum]
MKRKNWLALLLTLVLALSALLAGCSANNNGTQSKSNSDTSNQTAKADEQVINLNLRADPPNLNPFTSTDMASFDVLNDVLDGLVRYDKNGEIKPGSGLAKSWDISSDGLTYTFHLKDGIKWSDGNPITAQDFEYSWKKVLDPKTASQYAYQFFYIQGAEEYNSGNGTADQVGIKALDDKTLQVKLKSPAPQFLGLTAFGTYLPQEKSFVEKIGVDKLGSSPDTLVYSGPFVIKEWNHDQSVVLEKNPNYWDKDSVKLEKVNFLIIKDANTQAQNYDNGTLDQMRVPSDLMDKYKNTKEFSIKPVVGNWYIQFNDKKGIFTNVNIRKAFTLAINRKAFTEQVLKDGSIPAMSIVPPGVPGYNNEDFIKQDGAPFFKDNDVQAAKDYLNKGLKELGLTKLPTITFTADDTTGAKKASEALQQMWKQNLGADVQLKNEAFKIRIDDMNKGNFDMVLAGWSADYNDPMTFLDMWETDNGNNTAFYSNPEYDKLIDQAKVTVDLKQRNDYMIQAEKIAMDDMAIGPLYFQAYALVTKSYVKDLIVPTFGTEWELKWTYIEGKNK